MADRTKPIRSIEYQGERIKVTDRDYALYTMVKDGEITEVQLRELQDVIAEDSTYVQTRREARIVFESQRLEGAGDASFDAPSDPGEDGEEVDEPEDQFGDEFMSLPDAARMELYASIGINMLLDLETVPFELIEVYNYGMAHDVDARASIKDFEDADKREAFENLTKTEWMRAEIMESQYQLGDWTNDPMAWDLDSNNYPVIRPGRVSDETEKKLTAIGDMGQVHNELLFDVALTTVLTGGIAGFSTAVGYPIVTLTGQALAVQATTGGLGTTMTVAARLGGRAWSQPVIRQGIRYGSAIEGVTGTAGVIGRSIDQALGGVSAEDLDKALQMAAQVEASAPVAKHSRYSFPFSPDDPYGQDPRITGLAPAPGTPEAIQAEFDEQPEALKTAAAQRGAAVPGYGDREGWDDTGPKPPSTSEAVLEEERRAAGAERVEAFDKAYEADPWIGVDRGYRMVEPSLTPEQTELARTAGLAPGGRGTAGGPQYRASDVGKVLGRMTPRNLETLQNNLIDARIIDPDSKSATPFLPGVAGYETVKALEYVMSLANRSGKSHLQIAEEMAQVGRERTAEEEAEQARLDAEAERIPIRPYVPNTYIEPDMAELRVSATQAVEARLGRKINNWELELLADQMKADHQENFDRMEATRRAQYTAGAEADMGGTLYEPSYVEAGEPVEAVDYEARMEEQFNKLFSKEIQQSGQKDYVADRSEALFGGMENAMSAIRGG